MTSSLALLTLALVLAVALAAPREPRYEPIFQDYHEEVGVPLATRILAAERALDFDGSRITGGSLASVGQFPYMGGVLVTLTTGATSVCGSSLVSNTRALTAAHCWVHGRNQARFFTVVLGSVQLSAGGTRVGTTQVQLHAGYNQQNLNNDIAIITLPHVTFTSNIRSIQMVTGTNQFVGAWAQAVGFGRTADNAVIGANQRLSHVSLQVISNAVCQQTFGPSNVIASTLCTSGAGGRSVCGGDSGGPLAIGNLLVGVTCFVSGSGCTRGLPAGFQRVSSFTAWIRARM